MFSKSVHGGVSVSKQLRMSIKMESALSAVAQAYGWKPSDLIEYVLDEFLQKEVTKGTIPSPDIDKAS